MRRLFMALAGLVAGYLAGGLLGALLVSLFSANMHDRSVEAAMTGAFVTGPLGAFLGLVAGFLLGRRR
jgi:hypothetical protein